MIKLLLRLEEYVKWMEKVSLVCMWQNDGPNVSTLEKETLNIYHVMEDLNYGILRIYMQSLEENTQKVSIGYQKNLVHQIPYIARLRHLENHTEASICTS